MAVITDAERKKTAQPRTAARVLRKKQRKEGCAEQRTVSQKTRRRISPAKR